MLDRTGRALFCDLMLNRGTVIFAAFDLPWLDGRNLRGLPLTERKEILRFRIQSQSNRVLFVDHIRDKRQGAVSIDRQARPRRYRLQAGDQSLSNRSRQDEVDQDEEPKGFAGRGARRTV